MQSIYFALRQCPYSCSCKQVGNSSEHAPVNSKKTGTITQPPSLKPFMMAAMYVMYAKIQRQKTFVFKCCMAPIQHD